MAEKPPYLPSADLVEGGYLQEANRRFFHPLGLALEVTVVGEPVTTLHLTDAGVDALRDLIEYVSKSSPEQKDAMADLASRLAEATRREAGERFLSGVWDCRDDPEGIIFDPVNLEKADRVRAEWAARRDARIAAIGQVVEGAEDDPYPA